MGDMSFPNITRIRVISAAALVVASSVSILGGMVFVNEGKHSNAFFGVMALLYMPGLTVAAVVGGALGIGNIHDPSLVLAGVLNFSFYGWGSFSVLKRVFKPKISDDSSARR
jgi:hypothetical protein